MRNTEADFFMFIAAIVLGLLISLNIDITNTPKKDFMTIEEYQDAYEKKASLYSDISALDKEKKVLEKKIEKHKDAKEDEKISSGENIEKDLQENKNKLGLEDVKGEGIIIELEDGGKAFEGEIVDSFIQKQRTIHDNDMNELLNDIRSAGGEAISINNQRLIYNSSVYCAGQFLVIDGVKTPAPFVIKIIGDSTILQTRLLGEESSLKKMINREIKVQVLQEDQVYIKAYGGNIELNNISKANNK